MKLNEKQIEFMQEDLSIELVQMLMQEWHYGMSEAMDVLYNSETFERLRNPATGLYFQSPGYVYTYLRNELTTGKLS